MRYEFTWDPNKNRLNLHNHHVSFRQATAVFRDPNHLSMYDEDHSEDEERWVTMGFDKAGVLRIVVHTFEQVDEVLCQVRIISARKATSSEESQYREANS